jgi:hypothetical protein
MAPAENAERFAKEYLGFLSSLRFPTTKAGCHGNYAHDEEGPDQKIG